MGIETVASYLTAGKAAIELFKGIREQLPKGAELDSRKPLDSLPTTHPVH